MVFRWCYDVFSINGRKTKQDILRIFDGMAASQPTKHLYSISPTEQANLKPLYCMYACVVCSPS